MNTPESSTQTLPGTPEDMLGHSQRTECESSSEPHGDTPVSTSVRALWEVSSAVSPSVSIHLSHVSAPLILPVMMLL